MVSPFKPFTWRCLFCGQTAEITAAHYCAGEDWFTLDNIQGPRYLFYTFVVCPNPACREFTFTAELRGAYRASSQVHPSVPQKVIDDKVMAAADTLKKWQLIPASRAKIFPRYIPKAILDDYQEACLIQELSPKAAATLARRCLQGMIRDCWGIQKSRLVDEIEEIKDRVDPLTWEAIEVVRRVGNIGAHMEKDINLIVDVDPGEAGQLIGLIELLISDWYITRHEREKKLKNIVALGNAKQQAKSLSTGLPTTVKADKSI